MQGFASSLSQAHCQGCCLKGEQPEPEHIKADVAGSVGTELSRNSTEVQVVENLTLGMDQDDVVQTGRTDLTTVSAELLRAVSLRKTLQARGTLWRYKPAN